MTKKINNGVFYVAISLVAVLAVGTVALAYAITSNINVEGDYNNYEATQEPAEVNLGAVAGPDVYNRMYFHQGLQYGGDINSTSTDEATYTLGVGDIKKDTTFLNLTPEATTTITTMATSTVAMDQVNIPNAGDTREIWVHNNTAVAKDWTITLAAGTGVDLQMNEDTADLAIDGSSTAKLTFIRLLNTDVMIVFEQFDVAD